MAKLEQVVEEAVVKKQAGVIAQAHIAYDKLMTEIHENSQKARVLGANISYFPGYQS
ncbi:hypothetical protein [Brevibacillus laterosporus]|uniref:Uncharacterized protein n=1 Tax=Brevibacillus laterosporus LMG 15441 TaxID=1042163 RepID=A0A075R678_BRELA|nr:hypothetical protein [Brevibacillus laterosporus]AIG27299.1 hypothetical protein BRLA_c029870 [Brevibacillus laterosporus LMG 15441]